MTGVQKAVRIGRGAQEKLIAATIDCTVDLDPSQKGVHMSRFPELFEEAIEGVVADDAFLIEDLAEHVATRIVERQHAVVAEVQIRARYPYERTTPVTRLSTQEMVTLIGIAAASRTSVRRIVGVEAVGINACPCAQGLVRGQASERLLEAGFDDGRRRAHPRSSSRSRRTTSAARARFSSARRAASTRSASSSSSRRR